ncbi:hypothetical protein ISS07_00635 [Candidatus Woesearchaeota archaeon]|nr:hypothetical protein [Candidatus Woesearchaeota archaeon]
MELIRKSNPGFNSFVSTLYSGADEFLRNFGPDAYIAKLTDKPLPRNPFGINIAASAGDHGEIRESLDSFEPKTRNFGKVLTQYLDAYAKENNVDPILTTGACPFIGSWVTQEVSDRTKSTYIVGLAPELFGKKLNPEEIPLNDNIKHYDAIIYPDMPIFLRSPLVGKLNKGLIVIHGGYGSMVETATAADEGRVIGFYDIGSEFGMSKTGMQSLIGATYKKTPAVFFKNSDPSVLLDRVLTEISIKDQGIGDSLTSLVVYNHTHDKGNHPDFQQGQNSVIVNLRPASKPATFSHNGKWVRPVDQTLFLASEDLIMELFSEEYGGSAQEWNPRPIEVPKIIHPVGMDLEQAVVAAEQLRNEFGDRVVWHRQF